MTDDWDFYFFSIKDWPASIALDLGAARSAPDPARPWLLCVRLPLEQPRSDGLSSPEEAAALHELEERIDDALGAACGAEQVGRLTWNGLRELFYYGRQEEGFQSALDEVMAASPKREVYWRTEEDPEWTLYNDFLYPTPEQLQWIYDRRVVDQLRAHGDSLEARRPVDHYIYFPDAATRDGFLEAAAQRGFAGEPSDKQAEAPAEGGGEVALRFCAHLARMDSVDLSHIHDVVLDLRALAEAHSGEYDGWGCPVVRGGNPGDIIEA